MTNACLNHIKTGMSCIYPQGYSTLFHQLTPISHLSATALLLTDY